MAAQPYQTDLTQLFNPKSIAIIGASRDAKKIGYITVKNIIASGFKGKIYPVNPNAENIQNLKCYPKLQDLPETPDLAIISLPAQLVLETTKDCARANIKNIVIFSAGFKEIGEEGTRLEQNLKEFTEKNQLNVLGPNCLGFLNNKANINATFARAPTKHGNLRFISQSGALASSIFDWADSKNLGFSEFITLGNKATINECHILEYWLNGATKSDESNNSTEYEPIGMYLESISDGPKLVELATKLSKKHPIFILKPGKSVEAQRAMMSHTGSIAGADDILDAALAQAGVIRCQSIEELFNLSLAFSWGKIPTGSNIAVISNAGGPAVITSDAVEQYNLKLSVLSYDTEKILEQNLPREAAIKNPIDLLGDALADRYGIAMDAVLTEKKVDGMVVILTPQIMTEIKETAKKISEFTKKYNKPVFCSFIGGNYTHEGIEILNQHNIPTFNFPDHAVFALAKMNQWHKQQNSSITSLIRTFVNHKKYDFEIKKTNEIIQKAQKEKRKALTPEEATQILEIWGIPIPHRKLISNFEDAKRFVEIWDWPVVLKVSSEKILHKTDVGGVLMNIYTNEQLEKAYQQISKISEKIQIQKQLHSGIELIVGTKTDSVFGKALLFGVGGTLVEVLKDKNLAVSPIDEENIREVVRKSKVNVLLKGYRGSSGINFEALYALIAKVAKISENIEGIYEFEINPVIALRDGVWAIDARIVLCPE